MVKLFVDTNIVLDMLQKREKFYEAAQKIFTLADIQQVSLYVSALTIANAHYILQKHIKREARHVLLKFKSLVHILSVNENIIIQSLASNFSDIEDAIQYFTAIENKMEMIITRNKKDFITVLLPIYTPEEYLQEYGIA